MSVEEIKHDFEEEVEERERKPTLTLTLRVRDDIELKKNDVLVLTFFYDDDKGRLTCSLSIRDGSNPGSFKRIASGRIEDIVFVLKTYSIVKSVRSKYLELMKEFVKE